MNSVKKQVLDIIRSFLTEDYNVSLYCDIDELYELSNKLAISNIVGYVLNKASIKNTVFENSVYRVLKRHETLSIAKEEIDKLYSNEIAYVYVKGLSIAKYYKEPYLRYSTDLDIVVSKEDSDKAYKIFVDNGYRFIKRDEQEMAFISKDNVAIDLHKGFTFEKEEYENIFSNCFNDKNELDDNYSYIYMLIHTRKHFQLGVLHFKNFMDLFYLRDKIDRNIVNKVLNKYKLVKFDNCMNNYLDVLIGKRDHDEQTKQIEEFIFSYCNDAGSMNRILINSYGKSRFSYLLSRIFIPFERICGEYPILNKYKVLLPVYYVKRIIKIAFSYRGNYAKGEIINNMKVDKKDIQKMHDLIVDLQLLDK